MPADFTVKNCVEKGIPEGLCKLLDEATDHLTRAMSHLNARVGPDTPKAYLAMSTNVESAQMQLLEPLKDIPVPKVLYENEIPEFWQAFMRYRWVDGDPEEIAVAKARNDMTNARY